MQTLKPLNISVRDINEEDIPHVVNYWYHSPPGYIEAMGVDQSKMQKEEEMEIALREKCKANKLLSQSKLNALTILNHGQSIGIHSLYPIVEGDHAVFHAHIWNPELRGRGVGLLSYPLACKVFMDRFNLNRILFKTPVQNTGAIRVKEKLGIRYIGDEVIDFSIIKAGTKGKVFELTRAELPGLLKTD